MIEFAKQEGSERAINTFRVFPSNYSGRNEPGFTGPVSGDRIFGDQRGKGNVLFYGEVLCVISSKTLSLAILLLACTCMLLFLRIFN